MKKPILSSMLRLTACALFAVPAGSALADADVALCQLHQVHRWGSLNNITAYSVGTTSVNVGSTNLPWVQSNINHPVIGQTMYRISDGRISQIGQSWLKHSFCALQINSECDSGCPGQGGCLSFLAPGCQDPYAATRNGSHNLLGPKWQVNAFTGMFSYPAANGDQGASGNTIYMRLQVHNPDLDVDGAIYLVEGQYVTNAEAPGANTQRNNASYRLVNIGSSPTFSISFIGGQGTEFTRPAIFAWKDHGLGIDQPDPDVTIKQVQIPGEGQVNVGYKVSDNGDGTWRYEYAVHNLYSDRSVGVFSVPVPESVNVTNIGFHDVDYHSGDGPGVSNYDGTDWEGVTADGACTWSTESFDDNASANAIRWGTMYNFWFDADSAPDTASATIGLFKPGTPDDVTTSLLAPSDVDIPCPADTDGSGEVDVLDLVNVILAWDTDDENADVNDDGIVDVLDLVDLILAWGPCA